MPRRRLPDYVECPTWLAILIGALAYFTISVGSEKLDELERTLEALRDKIEASEKAFREDVDIWRMYTERLSREMVKAGLDVPPPPTPTTTPTPTPND